MATSLRTFMCIDGTRLHGSECDDLLPMLSSFVGCLPWVARSCGLQDVCCGLDCVVFDELSFSSVVFQEGVNHDLRLILHWASESDRCVLGYKCVCSRVRSDWMMCPRPQACVDHQLCRTGCFLLCTSPTIGRGRVTAWVRAGVLISGRRHGNWGLLRLTINMKPSLYSPRYWTGITRRYVHHCRASSAVDITGVTAQR